MGRVSGVKAMRSYSQPPISLFFFDLCPLSFFGEILFPLFPWGIYILLWISGSEEFLCVNVFLDSIGELY